MLTFLTRSGHVKPLRLAAGTLAAASLLRHHTAATSTNAAGNEVFSQRSRHTAASSTNAAGNEVFSQRSRHTAASGRSRTWSPFLESSSLERLQRLRYTAA
ncbi:hypothetical protein F2Q68_00000001 [Brassica cretica]|uniref:Uncharacterized protein n=1 Tax=Brassica cretica TaxID=69181 RepID=A0A8S9J5S8_BRACR|nr:hypothetical protein F2Q68_00000001 [Brassica cretica]